MLKISIITPVYNARAYIDATVQSVLNQSYENWEYILIDDVSTDGSFEYLKKKYSEHKNITVIQAPTNVGAGLARNIGLENANYDCIAFLDSDDIWDSNKLSSQVQFMTDKNLAIVHTSYSFIDDVGKDIVGKVNVDEVVDLNRYMRTTQIGMSTVLVDRSKTGDFRLDSIRTRQDTKLWISLLSMGNVSHGLNQTLVKYRVRPGQISGNKLIIAWRTFKVYMSVDALPWYVRVFNFLFYAFSGVIKRLNN